MAGSANLNVMMKTARKVGRALLKDFTEVEQLQVSAKGPGDFVSRADKRAEETIRNELMAARPSYGFLGEEGTVIEGEDPTRRIQKTDLMRLVSKGLKRNERLINILYYYEELTMKEIGATLDLSESRVSQMHSAIVERLQNQLGKRKPEFAMG